MAARTESVTYREPWSGGFPAQCTCGHLFLERFKFREPTNEGAVGFCWCGFCQCKLMIYVKEPTNA